MTRKMLLAIGLGIYAVALVVQAPASLVDYGLAQASHGRLRLANAQGTAWNGSGSLEIRDANGRNAIARNASWRVMPESLWRGKVVSRIELDGASRAFTIAASLSSAEIGDAEINLPAAALSFAEARLKPLQLSGDLVLGTKNLSFGRGAMQGKITVQWRAAGSAFSPVSPMGSYELRMDGMGKTMTASLATLEGPLQLDGSGNWTAGRKPDLNVTMTVPPEHREKFTPLLRLISTQRDEGTFDLQLK